MLEGLEQMEPGEMVSLMEGFGPEEGMLRFDGTPLDPEHTGEDAPNAAVPGHPQVGPTPPRPCDGRPAGPALP